MEFEAEVVSFNSTLQRYCSDCTELQEQERQGEFRRLLARRAGGDRETAIKTSGLQAVHLKAGPVELTAHQKKAEAAIDRAISGESWGAALFGPPGTGKSLIASRSITRFVEHELDEWITQCVEEDQILDPPPLSCRYASAREIALSARASFNSSESELSVLSRYSGVRFLVIDDVGTERLSPHSLNCLLHVVDSRWSQRMPLIITSNLKPSEIASRIADSEGEMSARRLVDRLADLEWVHVDGKSFRGRKG